MGQTHKSVNNYGPITQNIHANLIYSKINGVECGDFAPLNLSEKTKDSFKEGWFLTGDVALLEKGYFRLLGRDSIDVIK